MQGHKTNGVKKGEKNTKRGGANKGGNEPRKKEFYIKEARLQGRKMLTKETRVDRRRC